MSTKELKNFNESMSQAALKLRPHPKFRAGDTLRVYVLHIDGANRRTQILDGLCIARKNREMGSSFTVRKMGSVSANCVERTFPLYSPIVSKIEVLKKGKVRRAKLYYIRKLKGKKARIKEIDKFVKKTPIA